MKAVIKCFTLLLTISIPLAANAVMYDGFSGVNTATLIVTQQTYSKYGLGQSEDWRVEVDALWPSAPTGKILDINGEVALVRGTWDTGTNRMSDIEWETSPTAPWWQTDISGIGKPDPKTSTEPNTSGNYNSTEGVVPNTLGKHVFAARLLCSHNHDGATPFDELYSNPVGIYVVGNPDIDIAGLTETEESTIGGLVVRNYDSNNAPRQKITINKLADGDANWPGYIRLTRSSAVKVYDSSVGGTELTFNNIDNKFANSSLPIHLWVEGTNYSSSMRDIIYTAEVTSNLTINDQVPFTVLWVDKPSVTDTKLPAGMYSVTRQNYIDWTLAGTDELGMRYLRDTGAPHNFPAGLGYGYCSSAEVHPASFNYTGNNTLKLDRDAMGRTYIDLPSTPVELLEEYSKNFSSIPPGNDPGPIFCQDNYPAPDGRIYDWDAPGLPLNTFAQGTVLYDRKAFKIFATIKINDQIVRCSPVEHIAVQFSIIQSGLQYNPQWIFLTDAAHPKYVVGDNSMQVYTTPEPPARSWNLQ